MENALSHPGFPYAVSLSQQGFPSGLYVVGVRSCQGKVFRQKIFRAH